jgi:hypothetical protein
MNVKSFLLSGKYRPVGLVLILAGITLLILKFKFNWKPDFLELKIFAFYSFYIEAKSFTFITHQVIEEIGGVLLLSGMFMVAFSREKEESELLDALRLKAFLLTSYLNLIYLLISVLFFYGFGFVGALTFYMVFWLASYILSFRYLVYRHSRKES